MATKQSHQANEGENQTKGGKYDRKQINISRSTEKSELIWRMKEQEKRSTYEIDASQCAKKQNTKTGRRSEESEGRLESTKQPGPTRIEANGENKEQKEHIYSRHDDGQYCGQIQYQHIGETEDYLTDNTTAHSTNTNLVQASQSTIDIAQMSCSQLLRQMMGQENICDINDTQLSNYMLEMPINSFTRLLTVEENFENNMIITTSRTRHEDTQFAYNSVMIEGTVNNDDSTINEDDMMTLNNEVLDVSDQIEEDMQDHWDIDLFRQIHESQEGDAIDKLPEQAYEEREEEEQQEERQDIEEDTIVREKQKEQLEEEDVDNFLENDKIASSQGNNTEIDTQYIPQEGMEFNTPEEAHKFFNNYGYLAGFAVVIAHHARTQSKKRNNEVIRITYKCNRQGIQDTKKEGDTQEEEVTIQRHTNVLVKTNCKCCMVISERKGVWIVTRLMLEHNHSLSPGAKFFRAHKNMTEEEKKLIRTLNECNIPTKLMMYLLSFIRGGLSATPYRDKDISNYRGKLQRETSQNDMMQALTYFTKKREEDPSFYYKFLVDKNHKVKCIFWTDPRSIRYYQEYGDCLTFDTTYLTNKYRMPFAPFAGITGHGLTCIFGCALISDETTDTFKWLFQTFLEAMGGKAPRSIMTDQDGAMRSAIAQIFQHANHRNCVFHIKYKAELKCGRCMDKKDGLREELYDTIDNSLTKEEFESVWDQTITKHEVQHIKYFQDIYDTRERWAPVWFKQEFYPFINTTARSEGTNARYKRIVGPQYSITNFLKEYERIQETIYDNEAQADHETNTKKKSKLWSNYYMEYQAQEAYNLKIFKKFQWQLRRATKLQANEIEKNRMYEVFTSEVQTIQEIRSRKYIVIIDLQNEDLSCICGKFQKDGMLCCHILKVMMKNDISKIPEKYLIDRWKKKEKKPIYKTGVQLPVEATTLRFNNLSLMAAEMNSEGSKSLEKYEYLRKEIERITKELKQMEIKEKDDAGSSNVCTAATSGNIRGPSIQLLDPDVAATKGRPSKLKSNKRLVPKAEQMKRKKKQKYDCQKCKSTGHNTSTCTVDFSMTQVQKGNNRQLGKKQQRQD